AGRPRCPGPPRPRPHPAPARRGRRRRSRPASTARARPAATARPSPTARRRSRLTCPSRSARRRHSRPGRLMLGVLLAAPAPVAELALADARDDRVPALVRRALLGEDAVADLLAATGEQLLQR